MVLHWQEAVVFLLLGALFVHASPITGDDVQDSYRKLYQPQIRSVVNYLNSEAGGRHFFRFHNFVDATKKTDDVTVIDIEVTGDQFDTVDWRSNLFTCRANVEYFYETDSYETLPGVECHPKTLPNENLPTETTPAEPQLVHKSEYCPGCTVELDTNVPGVDHLISTALHHLDAEKPRRHAFVRVLRLQREIVSGVKFILLLEVAPTICEAQAIESPITCAVDPQSPSEVCRVEFIQKPWLGNEKHIISNNCTLSQDFAAVNSKKNRNDFDNEIDVNNEYKKSAEIPEVVPDSPNYEKMAETGNLEPEISPSRLLDIEAQIIPTDPTDRIMRAFLPVEPLAVETTKFGMDNSQLAVEDVPSLPATTSTEYEQTPVSETETPVQEKVKVQQMSSESQESTESSEDVHERVRRSTTDASSSSEESVELKTKIHIHNLDEEVTETTTVVEDKTEKLERKRRQSSQDGSSSSEESSENKPKNDGTNQRKKRQAPDNKSSASDESNESKPAGGTALRRKRSNPDDNNNSNEESHTKTFEDVNDEDVTLDNNALQKQEETQFKSLDSSKLIDEDKNSDNNSIKKQENQYDDELAKIGAESLDDYKWRHQVLEVKRVKKLELEGAIYRMNVRFAVMKCNPINDDCCRYKNDKLCSMIFHHSANHTKLLKSRCHKVEVDTHKNRMKRGVPGGVQDATSDPAMLQFAKDSLLLLDSRSDNANKYKLLKIHNASSQVVAGKLYKLKVDIIESDCLKNDNKDTDLCGQKGGAVVETCTIKIWDRPWLPHGKETTVMCDDKKHVFRSRRAIRYNLYDDTDATTAQIRQFAAFKEEFNKQYTVFEESYRFRIFNANMKKAAELNKAERGSATYGASRFADLSPAEFKQYLGYRPELRQPNHIPLPPAKIPDIELPEEFDWRTKGAVTPVKDQGSCGSCWAFSVTGNVEGQYAIKHDKLLEFSEQELVDCDKMDNGCDGGLMDNAYRAIEELGGLELENDYPYDAEDEKCTYVPSKSRVQLTGAVNVSSDEEEMAKFLVKNGPISIAINANAMQLYMGGVSHPWRVLCDPKSLDHGVLIVGYGIHRYKLFHKEMPYWIVKNSWGPRWGEQGYYRVYRGDGTCGVNQMASSAIVA